MSRRFARRRVLGVAVKCRRPGERWAGQRSRWDGHYPHEMALSTHPSAMYPTKQVNEHPIAGAGRIYKTPCERCPHCGWDQFNGGGCAHCGGGEVLT